MPNRPSLVPVMSADEIECRRPINRTQRSIIVDADSCAYSFFDADAGHF